MLAITISTLPATDITLRSATIGADLTDSGGGRAEIAVYWGDNDAGKDTRAWDNVVNFRSSPVGQYTTPLANLNVNTTYYYRAFALNPVAGGTQWTDVASFTTLPPALAKIDVDPVGIVGGTSANISGRVTDNGGDTPKITVVVGRTDGGNSLAAWEHAYELGAQDGAFATRATGLLPATDYAYRVVALNGLGATWSSVAHFSTLAIAPLRISEFLAANGTIALSRVRATPEAAFPKTAKQFDWIEIENATATPRDLTGYHLTDNADLPLQWTFPAGTTIPPLSHLVVYASGEDIADTRLDEQGRLHTNFQLSSNGEYLALTDPQGSVVHAYRNVPTQYRDVSYGVFGDEAGYLPHATPGTDNDPLPPNVFAVEHAWQSQPAASQLVVTAEVAPLGNRINEVQLHYRAMFNAESIVAMHDDGQAPDAVAGDGKYAGVIPGDVALPGQMIRYYVTAHASNGLVRREPMYVDPSNSPQYFGTVIADPTVTTPLPILHRFIETPRVADTARGTRASIYYDGEFYDNVFIRIRGGTARDWPKKSYKIEFNDDHEFQIRAGVPRVTEININATYTDKSYLRAEMTSDFMRDAGTPAPETFHIQMRQNGEFFSLAFLIEQIDTDFLRRNGLDADGALYKAGPGSTYTAGSGSFEKKNRDDEDKSDINALLIGLKLQGAELEKFIFDNVNLAAQINYMATIIVTQDIDGTDKNHFTYRDTNGTGEWFMLPWDLDLAFGPDALNTDVIIADQNTRGAANPTAVHPFLGSKAFPLHVGKINMLMDAIYTTPRTREMFLRRLRTLTDQYLATDYFQKMIDNLSTRIVNDAPLDRAKWKAQAHFGGRVAPDFQSVTERIKTEYLARRLPYLTEYHVTGGVGIPTSQPGLSRLTLGKQANPAPASGAAGDEYITLTNPLNYAVDLSNWTLSGSVQHRFAAGTVLPAGETMYLTASSAGFRARTQSPTGKEGLFVQQYSGSLPDSGARLTLKDTSGQSTAEWSFGTVAQPADASNLRISEIHYKPHDGFTSQGEALAGSSQFEFVEVTNISSQPIELGGVHFSEAVNQGESQGISFTFAPQVLAAGQAAVVIKNRVAFASRYGASVLIAAGDDGVGGRSGEFGGRLADGGEMLQLVAADGSAIQQLTYDDANGWPARADGLGSSLEWLGGSHDPQLATSWRASSAFEGTPGRPTSDATSDVVINEVLVNGRLPVVDRLELYNRSASPVDVSGWWLSDSGVEPFAYQIPLGTAPIPSHGFLVFDQTQLGFGFRSDAPDDAWLIARNSLGKPIRIADVVELSPTPVDRSQGRSPDGADLWTLLPSNTWGTSNAGGNPNGRGDFNHDGNTNIVDLDLICAALRTSPMNAALDLTDDAKVTEDDLDVMVEDILKTTYGDANLDGRFDSRDLVLIMQQGGYEDNEQDNSTWASGDWNCDGEFDSNDLVKAAARGKYLQ